MFVVGHMCWAYITAKSCSSVLRVRVNPYIILILGALPDIDLLLVTYGLDHRTITHSIVFWSILFIPIFFKYRKRSIPYFIAPIQHILFGDFIVGKNNPLWPIADLHLGLRLHLISIENIALEAAGLAIFLIWVNLNHDRHIFFNINRRSLLSIVTLVPLVAFLLFSYQDSVLILTDNGSSSYFEKAMTMMISSKLFPIVTLMHLILAAFLSISLVQGSRALLSQRLFHRRPL